MALRLLNHAEQVAAHLRAELLKGRWKGTLPGAAKLGEELDVNHTTIGAALRLLEKDGILVFRGAGRPREIVLPKDTKSPSLRIAILDYDPPSKTENTSTDLFHNLNDHGHYPFFTQKTLVELGMDTKRIARMIKNIEADAWIVASAPRHVLKWFIDQKLPALALFGAFHGLPIASASPRYLKTILEATRRIIDLGHRRIVFLAHRGRADIMHGSSWQAIFKEIESHGIPTGSYNLPVWNDGAEGFHQILETLFRTRPPTALVIEDVPHFIAALKFCNNRGLKTPRDLSMICLNYHPNLDYCFPPVMHIRWYNDPLVRLVARWADDLASNKVNHHQNFIDSKLVEGGTIGPAPALAD